RDRGPGHGGDTAGDRPHAEADTRGVAAHDDDAIDLDAELVRRDLRQRRLVSLTLRRHADVDEHGPTGIDADVGTLERADASAFDVRGHADAARPAVGASPLLLSAPALVIQPLEHELEPGHIVGGVVHDVDAVAVGEAAPVRHLLRADEVAPTEVGGIEADRAGRAIHEP